MKGCQQKHCFLCLKQFFSVLISVSFIILLTGINVWSDVPISGEALPGFEGFDKVMVKLIDKYDFPGASLAVAFKGKLVLVRGYGYSKKSLLKKTPVNPNDRFRFASLSKPITATAVMLLVEEGKLSLDNHIIQLLQDIGPQKVSDSRVNQITVRYLLEHRGGFDRNISGDPMFLPQPPCPGNIKSFLGGELDFTPGEKHVYSNIGYCILGRIIEKMTNKTYEDFIKERVLGPVGAKGVEVGASLKTKPEEVTYYAPPRISQEKEASPYGGFNLEAMDSHGGLIGSAIDYIHFLTSIDGQRKPAILQPNTFKDMLAVPDESALKDKPVYYAKGFRVRKIAGGGINFWHDGSLSGTLAIAVREWSGYSWVALFNSRPDDWRKVLLDIDRALWEGLRPIKEIPSGDLFDKY
jgi:N-acyl-D-amino-acid deacylase